MQYTRLRQRRFTQQIQRIGAGSPGVHDDRFAGQPGCFKMQPEGLLLHLRSFGLVVVIQTGFTNGNHMRMLELAKQPVQHRLARRLEIQRMITDRAIHVGMALGQRSDRRCVVGANADAEEMPDTARARSVQRGIQ